MKAFLDIYTGIVVNCFMSVVAVMFILVPLWLPCAIWQWARGWPCAK